MSKISLRNTPTSIQEQALVDLLGLYGSKIPCDPITLNSLLSIAKAWSFTLDECKWWLSETSEDIQTIYTNANVDIKNVAYLSLIQEYKFRYFDFEINKLLWQLGEEDNWESDLADYLSMIAKYAVADHLIWKNCEYAIVDDVKTLDQLDEEFEIARRYA